jgi:hypothetical protein
MQHETSEFRESSIILATSETIWSARLVAALACTFAKLEAQSDDKSPHSKIDAR